MCIGRQIISALPSKGDSRLSEPEWPRIGLKLAFLLRILPFFVQVEHVLLCYLTPHKQQHPFFMEALVHLVRPFIIFENVADMYYCFTSFMSMIGMPRVVTGWRVREQSEFHGQFGGGLGLGGGGGGLANANSAFLPPWRSLQCRLSRDFVGWLDEGGTTWKKYAKGRLRLFVFGCRRVLYTGQSATISRLLSHVAAAHSSRLVCPNALETFHDLLC